MSELQKRVDKVIDWCNGNIRSGSQVATFAVQVRDCLEGGEACPVPSYQQRVVEEHKELLERSKKLLAFIGCPHYMDLPSAEKRRLIRQLKYMTCYLDVLNERIEAFE